MIQIRRLLVLLLIVLCCGMIANAQDYTRSGNQFESVKKSSAEPEKTKFTWKDSKGEVFPIYISKSGSCFIIRISKTGKKYKNYLGPEISKDICEALGREYKNKSRIKN